MIAEEAADRQDAAQAAAAALTACNRDVALEEMQKPADVLASEAQLPKTAVAAEAAPSAPEPAVAPLAVRTVLRACMFFAPQR